MSKPLLLNYTGYELSENSLRIAKKYNFEVLNFTVPNANLASIDDVKKTARDLFEQAIKKKRHAKQIKLGNFAFLPTGHAGLAINLLTMFHGFCGHFPKFNWNARTENGFTILEEFEDLQSLRDEIRNFANSLNFDDDDLFIRMMKAITWLKYRSLEDLKDRELFTKILKVKERLLELQEDGIKTEDEILEADFDQLVEALDKAFQSWDQSTIKI